MQFEIGVLYVNGMYRKTGFWSMMQLVQYQG